MIEEFEARRRIFASIEPSQKIEPVLIGESLDRILAREVMGRVDLPGFDNSSMDGYAVRAVDASDGAILTVVGEQSAGEDLNLELGEGQAIRIFTGAPMPKGADAVVMQEDVRKNGKEGASIQIVEGVIRGENVRPRGEDVCAGQKILSQGSFISPSGIGLLASQGYTEVPVRPRPRVGIVTTGDELIDAGTASPADLVPGQLFNSNGPMLAALVEQSGGLPRCWHAPDEPEALEVILDEAVNASDFLLVAGGVSVGDRDFVKETLSKLDVSTDFWRVRVKPGKPFVFGHRKPEKGDPAYVFGLPGNPVSAFVTYLIFAAPALAWWSGKEGFGSGEALALTSFRIRLAGPLSNRGDRPHYLRMVIDSSTGELKPIGLQQSHALFGLSRSGALLRMEPGQDMAAGEEVQAWLL